MSKNNDDYDFGFEKRDFRWICQECGFVDRDKKEDLDFFKKGKEPHKCPKCKSKSLMPTG